MHNHDPANFWYVVTRASHYAACLLLMGVFAFDRFLAAPVLWDATELVVSWNESFRRRRSTSVELSTSSTTATARCSITTSMRSPTLSLMQHV